MQIQGIPWHAVVLEANEFAATKKLVTEVFGLTSLIEQDGWALFPMSNGTILDLYAPEHVPAYGFNGGIVFGFRVDDVEAASAELAAAGCELLGEITRLEGDEVRLLALQGPGRPRPRHQRTEVGDARRHQELAGPRRAGPEETTSAATMPDESNLGGGNA